MQEKYKYYCAACGKGFDDEPVKWIDGKPFGRLECAERWIRTHPERQASERPKYVHKREPRKVVRWWSQRK